MSKKPKKEEASNAKKPKAAKPKAAKPKAAKPKTRKKPEKKEPKEEKTIAVPKLVVRKPRRTKWAIAHI